MTRERTEPFPALARPLADYLAASHFDAATIARALEGGSVFACHSMDRDLLDRRLAAAPVSGALIRLLIAGDSIDGCSLTAELGEAAIDILRAAGVIHRDPESGFRAGVLLAPAEDLWIASDRAELHDQGLADFVVGCGPSTRAFEQVLIRRPVATALDLGCGSGYLACRLAEFADQVIATDINPRAVALCRFNAALNRRDNIECRQGSLFEPVAQQRFDLIACNPPYVLAPGSTFVYRDSEGDICRRIIRSAPDHLADGGTLQMACNWPRHTGQETGQPIEDWFEDLACGAWVLAGPELSASRYATVWVQQQTPDPQRARREIARWLEHFDQLGIAGVATGYVNLRRAEPGQRWLDIQNAPPMQGPIGETLARCLDARERLARPDGLEQILETRFVPVAELQRLQRSQLVDGRWRPQQEELRLGSGMLFGARVDPVAMRILARLDGERTLAEAGVEVALALNQPRDGFRAGLPSLAQRLLKLGMIVPAGATGDPAYSRSAASGR